MTATARDIAVIGGRILNLGGYRRVIVRGVAVGLGSVAGIGLLGGGATITAAFLVGAALSSNPELQVRAPVAPQRMATIDRQRPLVGGTGFADDDRVLTDPTYVASRSSAAELRRAMAFTPVMPVVTQPRYGETDKPAPPVQLSKRAKDHAAAKPTQVALALPAAEVIQPAHVEIAAPVATARNAIPLPRPKPVRRELRPSEHTPKVALALSTPPDAPVPSIKRSLRWPDPEGRVAVYDIAAHTVYMPNGDKLEAHSGLGHRKDDPRYIKAKNRGPTPPNVYELSLRRRLFHGVRAVRLTPVDEDRMFGRDGMLAHTYMLGPSGQSNGCVSFKDYHAFLRAYLKGDVSRMVVVPRLTTTVAAAAHAGRLHGDRIALNSR